MYMSVSYHHLYETLANKRDMFYMINWLVKFLPSVSTQQSLLRMWAKLT